VRSIAVCAVGYLFFFIIADVTQLIVSEHAGVVESTDDPRFIEDKVITQLKVRPMSWEMSGSFDASGKASGVLTSNVTQATPPPPPPLASHGKSTTGSSTGRSEQRLGLIQTSSKARVRRQRKPGGKILATTAQFGERRVTRAQHVTGRSDAALLRDLALQLRDLALQLRDTAARRRERASLMHEDSDVLWVRELDAHMSELDVRMREIEAAQTREGTSRTRL
jgi:hypothetical protein